MANFSKFFTDKISYYFINKDFDSEFPTLSNVHEASLVFEVALFTNEGTTDDVLSENLADSDLTNEIDGEGYERELVTFEDLPFGPGDLEVATYGRSRVANNPLVQFNAAGVGGWGNVTHFAIIARWSEDADTHHEKVLLFGGLHTQQNVNEGDIFRFPLNGIRSTFQ